MRKPCSTCDPARVRVPGARYGIARHKKKNVAYLINAESDAKAGFMEDGGVCRMR